MYREFSPVMCPALTNELVHFDDAGFRHMIYKGKDRRPIADQLRRFRLLKKVPEIIANSEVIHRKKELIGIKDKVLFISFTQTFGNKKITVVIRQIGNGRKHFFSVM